MKRLLILPLLTVFSCACASTPPKPVLYPDAHFVHITRGLKPTVSSMLRVDFYGGWGKLKDWQRNERRWPVGLHPGRVP